MARASFNESSCHPHHVGCCYWSMMIQYLLCVFIDDEWDKKKTRIALNAINTSTQSDDETSCLVDRSVNYLIFFSIRLLLSKRWWWMRLIDTLFFLLCFVGVGVVVTAVAFYFSIIYLLMDMLCELSSLFLSALFFQFRCGNWRAFDTGDDDKMKWNTKTITHIQYVDLKWIECIYIYIYIYLLFISDAVVRFRNRFYSIPTWKFSCQLHTHVFSNHSQFKIVH